MTTGQQKGFGVSINIIRCCSCWMVTIAAATVMMTMIITTTLAFQQQQQPKFHPSFINTHRHNVPPYNFAGSSEIVSSSSSSSSSSLPRATTKIWASSYNQQMLMDRVTTPRTTSDTINSSATFPQTWVPMGSIYELDGTKPNSIYFFGQEYIIYQNKLLQNDTMNYGWCITDSICPHRLAPLREGRIIPQTQQIQCSYHGWIFDGTNNGICTSIPQLPTDNKDNDSMDTTDSKSDDATPSSNTQQRQPQPQQNRILSKFNTNQQCSIKSYPCVVVKSIIWAWLWSTDSNINNNNNNNALQYTHLPEYYLDHLPPQNDDDDNSTTTTTTTTTTFTRIVPYSYDILIENIMDISHVPFAHHTLQGTRNDANMVKPIVNTTIQSLSSSSSTSLKDGFIYHFIDQTRKQTRIGSCTFKAPYLIHYNATFIESQKPFTLTTLLIPVSPGYSKIIILSTTDSSNSSNNKKKEKNSTSSTAQTTSTSREDTTSIDTTAVPKKKSKSRSSSMMLQRFIFSIIFPRLPIWFLHTFSNRFLDSDLMLLHDQEIHLHARRQFLRKQQHVNNNTPMMNGVVDNTSVSSSKSILQQYFMPSKADRSIVAIRKWISQYASAVYDLSSTSTSLLDRSPNIGNVGVVVPPYKDRTLLFDRYNQHTKHCKHCNTILETTLPKYKTYSYAVLSLSILLWNRHILFRLFAIGSILSFRIYNWIDHTLRYGDFDHSRNH